MALRPWAERCAESATRPQKMQLQTADCTIGGNSPTELMGVIEDTPGNTPMNRAKGQIRKMPGVDSRTGESENPYNWISNLTNPESYPWGLG